MQFVVKVWSSNSERGLNFDYAIIECTPAFLDQCLQRIGAFRTQKGCDPPLDEMHYWDLSAQYFDVWNGSGSAELDGNSSQLARCIDVLEVDRREAVLSVDDLHVSEGCAASIECAMMIVRNEGIAFSALLKDDEIRLTTAEISQNLLEIARSSTK